MPLTAAYKMNNPVANAGDILLIKALIAMTNTSSTTIKAIKTMGFNNIPLNVGLLKIMLEMAPVTISPAVIHK